MELTIAINCSKLARSLPSTATSNKIVHVLFLQETVAKIVVILFTKQKTKNLYMMIKEEQSSLM